MTDLKLRSKIAEAEQSTIPSVSCSAIIDNEQVSLFYQFDDDEPIEAMKGNGKKFTIEMMPVKNNSITFTDGKKTMKLFVKHSN
jgi:hypothetical protein